MSAVFVDTSAFFALMVSTDRKHHPAVRTYDHLARETAPLTTTSYVLVETYALLRRRVGVEAVRTMRERIEPLLDIVWVDAALHEAGLEALSRSRKKKLSLVDCVSFESMRRESISRAFAFDPHFDDAGFELL